MTSCMIIGGFESSTIRIAQSLCVCFAGCTVIPYQEWILWSRDEMRSRVQDANNVILLSTIQDASPKRTVPMNEIIEWLDDVYCAGNVYPTRKAIEWIQSKIYCLSLKHVLLPTTEWHESLKDVLESELVKGAYGEELIELHFKPTWQSNGRGHSDSSIDVPSKLRYKDWIVRKASTVFKSGRALIAQAVVYPFIETKRIVTSRDDPDPIAQHVWTAALLNDVTLEWFRLDTVLYNGRRYLNEITITDASVKRQDEVHIVSAICLKHNWPEPTDKLGAVPTTRAR